MKASMGRRGDCWDNSVAESFFAILKNELIYRQPWPTKIQTKKAINEYITGFYNCSRRHSHNGGLSPIEFERRFNNPAAHAA
ncbi:MAG: IS3 family transposase [Bradymonadia bacterium]